MHVHKTPMQQNFCLELGGFWTLPTLPTPLLRHWTDGESESNTARRQIGGENASCVVCLQSSLQFCHASASDRCCVRPGRKSGNNRAVIDRRLCPRRSHLGSYLKRPPKSSPVRPLAYKWYYCAQFIAKPKATCALRFSWTLRRRRTEPRPCTKNLTKIGRAVSKI